MGKRRDRRKAKKADRKAKRQGKRLKKRQDRKAKHEQRKATKSARKTRRKEKRKAAFKEIGKGAKAVFHEVKDDVKGLGNFWNDNLNPLDKLPKGGMSTTLLIGGGVAVAAMIVLR